MKLKNTLKRKGYRGRQLAEVLVIFLLTITPLSALGLMCQERENFPKVLQGRVEQTENYAQAIVTNQIALFVGGNVPNFEIIDEASGFALFKNFAHVGCIELERNTWSWSNLVTDPDNEMTTINALAIEPSGARLAALGESS